LIPADDIEEDEKLVRTPFGSEVAGARFRRRVKLWVCLIGPVICVAPATGVNIPAEKIAIETTIVRRHLRMI
jgi:hypothetical protein